MFIYNSPYILTQFSLFTSLVSQTFSLVLLLTVSFRMVFHENLLIMKCFSIFLNYILSSLLKDIFVGYKILGYIFFPCRTLKDSLLSFSLDFCSEVGCLSAISLKVIFPFSVTEFMIFDLSFVFFKFSMICLRDTFFFIYPAWDFLGFSNL